MTVIEIQRRWLTAFLPFARNTAKSILFFFCFAGHANARVFSLLFALVGQRFKWEKTTVGDNNRDGGVEKTTMMTTTRRVS